MSVNWECIFREGIKQLKLEDFSEPQNNWKRSLESCDRHDEKIAYCDRILDLKPNFTEVYYYRGCIRKKSGDLAGAIIDFTRVIDLDPTNANGYFQRATCYCYLGNHDSGLKDFTKLIEFKTTARRLYNRGVVYYVMKEYDKAIADFTQTVELKPRFVAAYFNLGNAYYELNDCQQAYNYYKQAKQIKSRLNSHDEYSFYATGIAALNQERINKGIQDLRQAASICCEVNNFALNLKINLIIMENTQLT